MRVVPVFLFNFSKEAKKCIFENVKLFCEIFFPAESSHFSSFVHCLVRIVTPVHSKLKPLYAVRHAQICCVELIWDSVLLLTNHIIKKKKTVAVKKLDCKSMTY